MKSKTNVLASAIAVAVTLSLAGGVQADGHMKKKDGGFYLGAAGAVSIVDDFDFTNGRSGSLVGHTIEWDTGYGGLLRGGYKYNSMSLGSFRSELELGARKVDIDKIKDKNNSSGDTNLYSAMLNGAFDFDTGADFSPYLSIGLGIAVADGDLAYDKTNPTDGPTQEVEQFAGLVGAGQLGAGISYALNDDIDAAAGYSLMAAPTDKSGASETLLVHSVLIGLNYNF